MSSFIANIFLLDQDEPPKGSLLSASSFATKSNNTRIAKSAVNVHSQEESYLSIPSRQSSIFSEVLLLNEKQPKVSLLKLSKTTHRGRACSNIRSMIHSVRSVSPNFRESDHHRNDTFDVEVDQRNEVDAVKCTTKDISPEGKQRETEQEFESNFERDKAELIFVKGKEDGAKKGIALRMKEMLCAPNPNLSTVSEMIQATNVTARTDLYTEDKEFALDEEVFLEGREMTLEDFKKLENQSQKISLPGKLSMQKCKRQNRSSSTNRGGDRVQSTESSIHENQNSECLTSDKSELCDKEQGHTGKNRGRSSTRYARLGSCETGNVTRRNRSSSRTRGGFNETLEAMSYSQKASKQNNGNISGEIEHDTLSPVSNKPENEVPGSGEAHSSKSTKNNEGLSAGGESPLVTTECIADGITEDNRHRDAISQMEDKSPAEPFTLKSTRRGRSVSSRSRCGSTVRSIGSLPFTNRKDDIGSEDKMNLSRQEPDAIEISRGRARTRSDHRDSIQSSVIVCRNRSSSRTRSGNDNTVKATSSLPTPSPANEAKYGDDIRLDRESMPEGQEITLDQFSRLKETNMSVQLMRKSTRRGRSSSRSRGGRSTCSSPERTASSYGERQHEDISSNRSDTIEKEHDKRVRGRVRSSSRVSYDKNNLKSVAVSRRSRSSSRTRGGYNEVLETMSCHRIQPLKDASEFENDNPSNDDTSQPRPSVRNRQPSEQEEYVKDDASREVDKPSRRGRSASRTVGWNNLQNLPSKIDRTKLRGAVSHVERKQLEVSQTRSPRARSVSLTRRVNVFEDYDQKQSSYVKSKVTVAGLTMTSNTPVTLSDNTHSALSSVVTAFDGIYKDVKMPGVTSDRMARLRSRSNAILLEEEGSQSILGVSDQIENEVDRVKSRTLPPRQQHGRQASYSKAVGDVVIARSISVGSENYSNFNTDVKKMAMRRLNARSTAFAPDNQGEEKATSNEVVKNAVGATVHGAKMKMAGVPSCESSGGTETAPPEDLLTKLESKFGGKKVRYDEMSDSYYDDVSDNLESIYDAGSTLDSSTLPRDDKSAETSVTDITDCTDTSDITMEDLREEAAEMCSRTCHTLDASLGDFRKTRAYRILSMLGKKGATETVKVFQSFSKLQLSEISGCMDKSFKSVVGVMDAECEKFESKAKSCAE